MANATDNQTSEDTGLSDAVDTTTNEDDPEQALEDMEVSFEDDTESEEESTDEAATESETDTEDESEEAVEETETSDEDAETSEEDATEEDTTQVDAEAERKAHNDEMAKARIEAKRAREEAEAVRKQAEESNIERYLQEAADDEDELKSRQNDVREYRLKEERIELNTQRLQTQVDRAYADIDLFKTGTPKVREQLLKALDEFEANRVVKDERGRPTEVKGDVYQYLQDKAADIRELLGDGATQQQKSKTSQKTRTLQTPVKTPAKPKRDLDMEAFDEVASTW